MTEVLAVDSDVVEVTLPNGVQAYVTVNEVEGSGATKTSAKEFNFDTVIEALKGFSDVVHKSFAAAAPTKTTLNIGIELAVKSGNLTALLVSGGAKGALDVTLEWDRSAKKEETG